MTIREKLADWISGGALSRAKLDIANCEHELAFTRREALAAIEKSADRWDALFHISLATEDGKSGTAKKIHRMATEALK